MKKLVACFAMNRMALWKGLIGDDYLAAVEMMNPDDACEAVAELVHYNVLHRHFMRV